MTPLKKNIKVIFILIAAGFFLGDLFAQEKRGYPEDKIKAPRVEYKADSLRNPFLPYEQEQEAKRQGKGIQAKPLPALTIQGVIWGTSLPQVIINGMVLKVGDSIAEAQVTAIDKNGVELFYAGSRYFISSPASGGQITGGQR